MLLSLKLNLSIRKSKLLLRIELSLKKLMILSRRKLKIREEGNKLSNEERKRLTKRRSKVDKGREYQKIFVISVGIATLSMNYLLQHVGSATVQQ